MTDVGRGHLADGHVQRAFHVIGAADHDELIETVTRVWVRTRVTGIEECALGDAGPDRLLSRLNATPHKLERTRPR